MERLLQDTSDDPHRWKKLIGLIDDVPERARERVIQWLKDADRDLLSAETRLAIHEGLQSLISDHRAFPEARWVLPEDVLDQLDAVRERYEPETPLERYAWLFSNGPKLMAPFGRDWEARHQAVSQARLQATELIYAQSGLNALVEFATRIEQPDELGRTLGMSELLAAEEDSFLSQYVRSEVTAQRLLARAYVVTRGRLKGWQWIEEKLAGIVREAFSQEQQAEFFQFLPFTHRSWELLASFGPEAQKLYWAEIEPRGLLVEDLEEAITHLLQHERSYAAFYAAVSRLEDIRPGPYAKFVADALERFLLDPRDLKIGLHSVGHHISSALAYIEASGVVPEERIARLEWLCLPFLERGERGPRILHLKMAREPQFFVELLTFVYRAASEEPRELTPDEQLRNQRAYDLIRTWRDMPGKREDGSIDTEELKAWITEVRTAAQAVDRLAIADNSIGEVLARSPSDPDGSWPSVAVRDIIEAVASEELESGFRVQVFNSRGVFTKSIGEGGAQERELAAKYRGYANLVRARWPRTARMLDLLADRYLADAREADRRAELEEDLLR